MHKNVLIVKHFGLIEKVHLFGKGYFWVVVEGFASLRRGFKGSFGSLR